MSLSNFRRRWAADRAVTGREATGWLRITRTATSDEELDRYLEYVAELCEAAALGLDTSTESEQTPGDFPR